MRLEQIEFDREAKLRPVAVELEPLLDVVRPRLRETSLEAQLQESPLQTGPGEAGGLVERDRFAQPCMAVMAGRPI